MINRSMTCSTQRLINESFERKNYRKTHRSEGFHFTSNIERNIGCFIRSNSESCNRACITTDFRCAVSIPTFPMPRNFSRIFSLAHFLQTLRFARWPIDCTIRCNIDRCIRCRFGCCTERPHRRPMACFIAPNNVCWIFQKHLTLDRVLRTVENRRSVCVPTWTLRHGTMERIDSHSISMVTN